MICPSVSVASTTAAGMFRAIAKLIIATFNSQDSTIHNGIRQFLSGAGIDLLNGGAGDLHIGTTFLLGKALLVNQANGFIFIHGHRNNGFISDFFRYKLL